MGLYDLADLIARQRRILVAGKGDYRWDTTGPDRERYGRNIAIVNAANPERQRTGCSGNNVYRAALQTWKTVYQPFPRERQPDAFSRCLDVEIERMAARSSTAVLLSGASRPGQLRDVGALVYGIRHSDESIPGQEFLEYLVLPTTGNPPPSNDEKAHDAWTREMLQQTTAKIQEQYRDQPLMIIQYDAKPVRERSAPRRKRPPTQLLPMDWKRRQAGERIEDYE
jgi:hypothetical protein